MTTMVRVITALGLVLAVSGPVAAQVAPTGVTGAVGEAGERGVSASAGTPAVATDAAPADALPLSLDEALRSAAERSEEVKLARSRVDLAGAQVMAARSAALPQVNANLGYTRTFRSAFDSGSRAELPDSMRFDPDPSLPLEERVRYLEERAPNAALGGIGQLFGNLPFGQKNAYTASLSATQMLYAGGRVGAALEIARDYEAAVRDQMAEEVADLEFQVRSAYYRALFAGELERISAEALEQADRFLDQERLRQQAGRASELDVLRAEVASENLRPRLVEARNASALALLELKRLIGIPLDQPIRLTTTLPFPSATPEAAVGEKAAGALSRRPALAAADRQVEIREGQIRVAKGAYLPSAQLQVDYGRQLYPATAFDFGGDWRTEWSATVGVQIPIFSGFKRKADVEQAREQLEQAELQRAQLREAVELEYERARGERERARAELTARGRTVDQAQRVHDLTAMRYDRGLATQLEVSEARLALLQARTNLAQALTDFHTADAQVARAVGSSTLLSELRPGGGVTETGAGRGDDRGTGGPAPAERGGNGLDPQSGR